MKEPASSELELAPDALEEPTPPKFRASLEAVLWRIWRGERPLLAVLLWPLSFLFFVVTGLRTALYRWGVFKQHRMPVPVISVGNLVVGGAGKTPVVLEVSRALQRRGREVAILSRGYGRDDENSLVIVSDGEAVRASPQEGGDEPVWLAHALPGVRVVVCASRVRAAEQALELKANALVLDDGFSHLALHRDVDILVVDEKLGLGNAQLLPAGPLRESPNAGKRASLLWLSRSTSPFSAPPSQLSALPLVRSSYQPTELLDLRLRPVGTLEELAGARVLGVCGISRPESFAATLRDLGLNLRGLESFPDHHRYTRSDLRRVLKLAQLERCDFVLSTEKDALKLPVEPEEEGLFRVLRMGCQTLGDAEALDQVLERFALGELK